MYRFRATGLLTFFARSSHSTALSRYISALVFLIRALAFVVPSLFTPMTHACMENPRAVVDNIEICSGNYIEG